jgi:hypothetical protein
MAGSQAPGTRLVDAKQPKTSQKQAGKVSVVGKYERKNRQHRYFSTDKQRLSLQNGGHTLRHSEEAMA